MAQIPWNNMGEEMKEDWINKALNDSFLGAMKPENQGKVTPKQILTSKLVDVGQSDFSGWYSANTDWIPGRIAGMEAKYGFSFTATYTSTPQETDPNAPKPEKSWFAENKLTIAFIIIALATVGFFIYRKMKK